MASCIPYHGHIKINEYSMDQWFEYIRVVTRHVINEPSKNQARFVGQWKGLIMICETIIRQVELEATCRSQGLNKN
jgi:hypothetical protein